MATHSALPSYDDVADVLQKALTEYNPAQVHGIMCGLICATSGKEDNRWKTLLFGDAKNPDVELLTELYEASYHQMSEFSFEFTLLLPDDQVDIHLRAEALGLWCQGFITGLEHAEIPTVDRPPGEITEALNDIIEISQVSFDEADNNEEDETAYYELIEYVRLAALMIYHELKSDPSQNNTDEKNALH